MLTLGRAEDAATVGGGNGEHLLDTANVNNEGIGKKLSDYLIDIKNSEVTAEAEKDEEKQEVSADTDTEHLLGACDVRGVANVGQGGANHDGGDLEENNEQTSRMLAERKMSDKCKRGR